MIASEPYIDELEKSAKLLAKWPLDITQMKREVLARESKPEDRLWKNPIEAHIEISREPDIVGEEEVIILIIETTSKICKPRSYNEVVNNPVYGHC